MTSATGPSPDRRPAGGFTLLELIAVLVLISTVLAIAAPSENALAAAWVSVCTVPINWAISPVAWVEIVKSSTSVTDMVQNISSATAEQSLASAEIATSIDTMVGGSQQTAEATRETAQIGVELSNLAERLKEAAGQFKV